MSEISAEEQKSSEEQLPRTGPLPASRNPQGQQQVSSALSQHWAHHFLANNCDSYGLNVPQDIVYGPSESHAHFLKNKQISVPHSRPTESNS